MKLKKLLAGAVAVSLISGSAFAGEWADMCVERMEADGRDPSGCQCIEDQINANDLADEFLQLAEIADPAERYESASDAAKAAMDACTR